MSTFIGQPHDFDFLAGHWQVANRRLRRRLAGSHDWQHFDASMQGFVLLDGGVSVDEINFPSEGFSGCTVRTLDHGTGQWSIYWINSRIGRLFPPVRGGFDGARGEFFGDDEDDGRPVQVRFVWNKLRPDAARWEQSFSLDGRAWEPNWVMEMSRRTA
jgi:hypothetical protein